MVIAFDAINPALNFKNRIVNQSVTSHATVATKDNVVGVLVPVLHHGLP